MKTFRKGKRGFTLLELVLAMAITVVVASALAASLYIAYKARANAMNAVDTPRATDMAGDMITRELSVAQPPTGKLAGTFEGLTDTVDFFISGPEPKDPIQGDIRHIEYALEADPIQGTNDQVLVRRVWTNLLADVIPDPVEEVLARNVTDWEISYYDGTQWQDTWDSTQHTPNSLPLAVQITLELEPLTVGAAPRRTTRMIPLTCANLQQTVTGLNGGGGF